MVPNKQNSFGQFLVQGVALNIFENEWNLMVAEGVMATSAPSLFSLPFTPLSSETLFFFFWKCANWGLTQHNQT